VDLTRAALDEEDVANSGLPHFAAADKRGDPRCPWFVRHYGQKCWELDALDPNVLRHRVEQFVRSEIDFDAWDRCMQVERAEHQSLVEVMRSWRPPTAAVARTANFTRRAPLPPKATD
jgi:hypothetical protein